MCVQGSGFNTISHLTVSSWMKLAFFCFELYVILPLFQQKWFYPPVQISTKWKKRMCPYSYQSSADLMDSPQKGSQGLPRVLGYTLRTTAVDKASWFHVGCCSLSKCELDVSILLAWSLPGLFFSFYMWLETFNVTFIVWLDWPKQSPKNFFIVWLDCPKQSPKNFPHQLAIATIGVFILRLEEKATCILVLIHEYNPVPRAHFPCVRKNPFYHFSHFLLFLKTNC